MIKACDLTKRFGRVPVLSGVTLDVAPGECVVVLGANGSGKSTLLKLSATVLRPTAGTLTVLGHDVPRHAGLVRGHVGLVAHGAHLWEDLTALENLRVWRTLSNQPTAAPELRAALETVELDAVADERVRTFSAGMKRRLSLARFVDHGVRLLLLDEPFTGLDQPGKKWLTAFVHGFKARGGAVLMATHDLGRSLDVADRLAILAGGRIALDQRRDGLASHELEALYARVTAEA
jgi:heme ABC exporter ATP-binding subunit CcmA